MPKTLKNALVTYCFYYSLFWAFLDPVGGYRVG